MGTRSVTVRLDEGLVDWADARAAGLGVKRTQVLEAGLRLLRGENLAKVEAGLEEASASPVAASPPAAVGPAKSPAPPRAPKPDRVAQAQEALNPMSRDELRALKRSQTHAGGGKGVA